METGVFINIVKELGLSVGVFALCAWMVVYIVKSLGKSIEKLISRLDLFMNKVKEEHEQQGKHHEALMKEHDEMIKVLGRINGFDH